MTIFSVIKRTTLDDARKVSKARTLHAWSCHIHYIYHTIYTIYFIPYIPYISYHIIYTIYFISYHVNIYHIKYIISYHDFNIFKALSLIELSYCSVHMTISITLMTSSATNDNWSSRSLWSARLMSMFATSPGITERTSHPTAICPGLLYVYVWL